MTRRRAGGRRLLALVRAGLLVAAPAVGLAGHALAQAQVGAGVIAPPTSPIQQMQPPAEPQVTPPLAPVPETAPVEAGPPVHVTGVAIEGATVYPTADLARLFAGINGATVPRQRIADAVRKLQIKYREDGYFLTVVRETLEPNPAGDVLRVRVIEGYISDVKIDGNVGPVAVLVYNYLRHLTEKRPTKIGDVERYVLLAKNIPGITIRTILQPARDEPGAIELVAEIQKKSMDLLVEDDNRGPHTAGPDEMLFGIDGNSFTTLGERIQAYVYDTPFNADQTFGQLSYEGFLGSEGLKFRVYGGYGTSTPADILKPTGYHSNLLLAGGSLAYPVILTRALSLTETAALDYNQSEIGLVGTDGLVHPQSKLKLRIFSLSQDFAVQDDLLGFGRSAANSANITFYRGLPELAGSSNLEVFLPRGGERNDFYKFTTELIRVQNLFVWNADSVALKTAFAGQWTPDILPPTEKYLLGGEQFGRGFFSGEVSGDKAAAGTVEPQLNQTLDGQLFGRAYHVTLQYYTFFDIGQIWSNNPTDTTTHIESTGLGIRANLTSWLSTQVEGVERFTRRPNSATGSREPVDAVFFQVSIHL